MLQQTIFPFKIGITKERLTAHGGLALMAEFNHGIGLKSLTDKELPAAESNRGFNPSVFIDTLILTQKMREEEDHISLPLKA